MDNRGYHFTVCCCADFKEMMKNYKAIKFSKHSQIWQPNKVLWEAIKSEYKHKKIYQIMHNVPYNVISIRLIDAELNLCDISFVRMEKVIDLNCHFILMCLQICPEWTEFDGICFGPSDNRIHFMRDTVKNYDIKVVWDSLKMAIKADSLAIKSN